MRVHFIGVGEGAMCNLAISLQQNNYKVTGSGEDIPESCISRVKENGIFTKLGWFPKNLTSTIDAVILGGFVGKNNPELVKATELGLKIFSYSEFIYQYCKNKTRVVISGSQGKAAISTLILHVLDYHQKEIDFIVETQFSENKNSCYLTATNDFVLIEGHEQRSSGLDPGPQFHQYKPNIALLSNITLDQNRDLLSNKNYVDQYKTFVDTIVNGGILVYNEDDPEVKKIAEETNNPIRKHPYSAPLYSIENDITVLDTPEGKMEVEVFGPQNINHISGAKWICQHMGVDEDEFYEALASYKGL